MSPYFDIGRVFFDKKIFLSLPYLYIGKTGPVLAIFVKKSNFSIFQINLSNPDRKKHCIHNLFKFQCPLLKKKTFSLRSMGFGLCKLFSFYFILSFYKYWLAQF